MMREAGPCCGLIDADGYRGLLDSWVSFFEGDVEPLETLLTDQMESAAAEQRADPVTHLQAPHALAQRRDLA